MVPDARPDGQPDIDGWLGGLDEGQLGAWIIKAGRRHHPDDAVTQAVRCGAEDAEGFTIVRDDPSILRLHDGHHEHENGIRVADGRERVGRSHFVSVGLAQISRDGFQPRESLLCRQVGEVVEFDHDLFGCRCYQGASETGAKMKLMVCAVMAMSLAAGVAQAGDWREIGQADNKVWAVDISSIRESGRIKRAWFAVVDGEVRNGIEYSMNYNAVSCDEWAWGTDRYVAYTPDGSVKFSNSEPNRLQVPVPGSIGEKVVTAICQNDYHREGWPDVQSIVTDVRIIKSYPEY